MKTILALLCLATGVLKGADPLPVPPMDKFKAGDWEDPIGYRQGVRVGKTVYISGVVGEGDMTAAIQQAYASLKNSLDHYGLTFRHVVKETIYTTQLDALKDVMEKRRVYYGNDFPASSWVQVSRLYNPKDVIEVEVIAVFPD